MSAASGDEFDFARRLKDLDRANRRHRPRRYPSLLMRWLASAIGSPRPVECEPIPTVSPSQISITFGGHASLLIQYSKLRIAFDPMLGNRLGRLGLIRRAQAPGLRQQDLANADVVLISNPTPAHLHLPTLSRLPRSTTIVVPLGAAGRLDELGFDKVLALAPDQSFSQSGIDIHTTASQGDGPLGLGYVIRGNGPTLFACGRGGYGSSFREIGERHRPDLALLPIGGYWPRSFRRRHLSPIDALYAFEDLRARLLIPIHHGAFPLSYERLGEPTRWLGRLVAERDLDDFVVWLAPGESRIFTNPARLKRPTPHLHLRTTDLSLGLREIALP